MTSEKLKINTEYGVFYSRYNDLITDHLVKYSAHTRNELAMVLDHLTVDDIVLDVGSHIGTYSIPIGHKVSKGEGRVYSFEANKSSFDLLDRNVELGF